MPPPPPRRAAVDGATLLAEAEAAAAGADEDVLLDEAGLKRLVAQLEKKVRRRERWREKERAVGGRD